jgi:hypothetical protein
MTAAEVGVLGSCMLMSASWTWDAAGRRTFVVGAGLPVALRIVDRAGVVDPRGEEIWGAFTRVDGLDGEHFVWFVCCWRYTVLDGTVGFLWGARGMVVAAEVVFLRCTRRRAVACWGPAAWLDREHGQGRNCHKISVFFPLKVLRNVNESMK